MKRLVLKELMILSFRERKAKKIRFDHQKTLIKGTNQVGKSSLIKSIYYTLGATPATMHPNWVKAEPICLLTIDVDGEEYKVLRYDKKRFVVIENSTDSINSYNFKEFSNFINTLLDFNLVINNRQGVPEIPPQAYLFLPFYIDQDNSWVKNWNSFSNLGQYSKWKKPLVDYHSGIKGNLYYKTKSELDTTRQNLEETTREIDALNKILKNINDRLNEDDLSITVEDFNEEIKELLVECESLKTQQNKIKQYLTDLHNQKILIDSEISVVEKSMKELSKDYNYALNTLDDQVDCPTCGAHYENNFAERFSIAENEERLEELLVELRSDYLKITDKINSYNNDFIDTKSNYDRIQEVLNKKQSEIKLMDVIENEGKRKVKEIFKEEQSQIYEKIGIAERKKSQLESQLKDIDKKGGDRKDKIMTEYRSKLHTYLSMLNINTETFSEKVFQRMDSPINETGSALPRALLAYYFTFLEIMNKYSTSSFCPIIIDSPNQQEQDKKNLEAIIKFIDENQPENSQLIIGLVDDDEYTFDLNEEDSLLKADDYDEVYEEISPILGSGIFNDGLIF
ncbi:AAA family ATPase [Muricauda sp. SCSIO 64092]|uniref:AAA family ATPase n=1 Tax=Allomuricauda sp. SCSIO 64092 TaxID=2908842 RepID=UPI001FF3AF0E|nr:AAA family ATPase [Muricauda sp. SCSIO 64092]UOY06567.1 AAA family ATPase [Muricauda sp. SCSIO 64092]